MNQVENDAASASRVTGEESGERSASAVQADEEAVEEVAQVADELESTVSKVSAAPYVREQWTGRLDFLLSCLGYAVGLGNVWRFPYVAYSNGGGAFFIPYFIMLFFVGTPIFFLELVIGQFTSSGPVQCWDCCTFFQGVGLAMAIVSALTSLYYNVIMAWAMYYFVASMQSEVPWQKCGSWSTKLCRDNIQYLSEEECIQKGGKPEIMTGLCTLSDSSQYHVWDVEKAVQNGIVPVYPAQEYFGRQVTGYGLGYTITNLGTLRLELALCLLASWIIICLILAKGIKTSGKVVYVTATFPYIILTILLVRGLTLKGSYDGIRYYITPDISVLSDAKVWKDAAVQIFFSLSASYGGLIALASYNKFHNDILRDSLIVSMGNCLTSVYAGFVIFSFLGFLAQENKTDIATVAAGGPSLAFGVYPFSLTLIPGTVFWSLDFFIMLLMLGVDSQMVLTETVITTIVDFRPDLRQRKYLVVIAISIIMFFCGLVMTTDGGLDVLDLLDTYAGGWNVLIIAICECIAVAWVYGSQRFLQDIEIMIGKNCCCCFKFNKCCKIWWTLCWSFITPVLCMFVTGFSWVNYTRIERFPYWIDIFAWAITMSSILAIICTAFRNVFFAPGKTLMQKLRYTLKPNKFWGPALVEHRQLVAKYVANYDVYPG